jgi:hypothetical protein
MNLKKIGFGIYALVSVTLFIWYGFDSFLVVCEPCNSVIDCPPCQTGFMKNFWTYIIYWNLICALVLAAAGLYLSSKNGITQVVFNLFRFGLKGVLMASVLGILVTSLQLYQLLSANRELTKEFKQLGVTFCLAFLVSLTLLKVGLPKKKKIN